MLNAVMGLLMRTKRYDKVQELYHQSSDWGTVKDLRHATLFIAVRERLGPSLSHSHPHPHL